MDANYRINRGMSTAGCGSFDCGFGVVDLGFKRLAEFLKQDAGLNGLRAQCSRLRV